MRILIPLINLIFGIIEILSDINLKVDAKLRNYYFGRRMFLVY